MRRSWKVDPDDVTVPGGALLNQVGDTVLCYIGKYNVYLEQPPEYTGNACSESDRAMFEAIEQCGNLYSLNDGVLLTVSHFHGIVV